jgi:hypothetical protein
MKRKGAQCGYDQWTHIVITEISYETLVRNGIYAANRDKIPFERAFADAPAMMSPDADFEQLTADAVNTIEAALEVASRLPLVLADLKVIEQTEDGTATLRKHLDMDTRRSKAEGLTIQSCVELDPDEEKKFKTM